MARAVCSSAVLHPWPVQLCCCRLHGGLGQAADLQARRPSLCQAIDLLGQRPVWSSIGLEARAFCSCRMQAIMRQGAEQCCMSRGRGTHFCGVALSGGTGLVQQRCISFGCQL